MPPPGTLYLVATPIGNLEDLSPRARRILGSVACIAAEDTRTTRKLLSHCGLHTPLVSCFEHNEARVAGRLLDRLAAGESIALVSDAGTPGISDPGFRVVRAAVEAGITVVPIPGPCALVAALAASGLPTDAFSFHGFLPVKQGRRGNAIRALKDLRPTLIFYESPHRLVSTLEIFETELGDRPCAIARELTKVHEEMVRGTLSEVRAHFAKHPPRGECTIVVGGALKPGAEDETDTADPGNLPG